LFFQNFPNFQKINKSDWSVYLNQTNKKNQTDQFLSIFQSMLGRALRNEKNQWKGNENQAIGDA
jgi:hypothetical protein